MYVKVTNGVVEKYPYSIGELRKDNPTVSFPKNPGNDLLAEWNVFPVQPQNPPAFNQANQNCDRVNPTLQNGVWVETWSVTAASSDEINRRTAEMSIQVRAQRDSELMRSDWTQVADSPVDKAAWATYRQALRDIPSQPGFPWEVVWPTV